MKLFQNDLKPAQMPGNFQLFIYLKQQYINHSYGYASHQYGLLVRLQAHSLESIRA